MPVRAPEDTGDMGHHRTIKPPRAGLWGHAPKPHPPAGATGVETLASFENDAYLLTKTCRFPTRTPIITAEAPIFEKASTAVNEAGLWIPPLLGRGASHSPSRRERQGLAPVSGKVADSLAGTLTMEPIVRIDCSNTENSRGG